jgi:ATP synthase protein I
MTGAYREALMPGAEIARPPVHRITLVQLVSIGSLSLFFLAFDGVLAYSVLSGGLIAIVPQAYFAALAFSWRGARSAKAIARSGYAGELGKFLLSIAGFTAGRRLGSIRRLPGNATHTNYRKLVVADTLPAEEIDR